VLLLAGCTATVPQQQLGVPEISETAASATSIATLDLSLGKATPMPSMDLGKETCLAAGGMVEAFSLPSELLDHDLRLRVYTPPCYEEHTDATYPVLYFIHGQTYTEDQWDRLGADEAADALIANGEVTPFIIVMPADESHYTQPSANKFDEAVVEELIPWVDESYRTLADRESRAVGGLSRGASWAFHLAFTRPELFGAVGGHSPPVFQEDAPRMRMLLDELPTGLRPRIWLDIGERDQRAILESATWLEGLLDERDIPHHWMLNPGDHSEDYWRSHVELYLRWYAQEW
jgi:enterochelin esterase-like enzyme